MNRRNLIPALAFLAPLTVYLLTMPRGLTWAHHGADGGDLITAAVTLGVPHPSGYPTYTLLGWLFSRLPLGTPAWRLALLSAVATAGAAFWLYRIIAERTGNRSAAVIGAWAFALAPPVWGQAIIAEVYGVNLFFIGLLLWLAQKPNVSRQDAKTPRIKNLSPLRLCAFARDKHFWLGVVFWLALGTHLTTIFLLPILGYQLLVVSYQRNAGTQKSVKDMPKIFAALRLCVRQSEIRNVLIGSLLGAAIFLYLPLRAGHGAITWGEPNTLGGLWTLVSGQIYRGYLFAAPMASLAQRLPALARYFIAFGVVPLALAGLGAWRLWRREPHLLAAAGISAGGYIALALGYATADSFVYLLPVFLLMGISVGMGMVQLLADVSPHRHGLAIGAVMVILLLTTAVNWKTVDLHRDTVAENFWQSVLMDAPPDAVLLTDTDRATFALWYARFALGKRPDVAVVDTRLVAFGWHRADLQRHDPDLPQLTEIDTIFAQQKPYPRPLCRVLNSSETEWSIHCNR